MAGPTQMLNSFDNLFTNQNALLGWTIFLINHPDPKNRHPIQLNHLKQAALSLSPNEYTQEILVERNLNGLCGYPVCFDQPKDNTNPHQKNSQSNQNKIRSIHHQIIKSKQEETPKYCSQECQDRSNHYLHSVLKKISPTSDALSSKKKRFTNHERIIDPEKILLLEELNQLVENSHNDDQLQSMVPLEQSGSSSKQRQEYDHDFLQPFLTQFQSTLHVNDKRIDQNLNPIFSSIKIIEHPPQLSPSDPLHSSDHLNELEHQVLNQCPTFQTSSLIGTISSPRLPNVHENHQLDYNPIHEIPSSLTQTLNSNLILSNSNSGVYMKRRLVNGSSLQIPSLSEPPNSQSLIESNVSGSGQLEAQIIYNVGSVEDQLAIDQAMTLRDILNPKST